MADQTKETVTAKAVTDQTAQAKVETPAVTTSVANAVANATQATVEVAQVSTAPANLFVSSTPAVESKVAVAERSSRYKAFTARVEEYIVGMAINNPDQEKAKAATVALASAIVGMCTTSGQELQECLSYLVKAIAKCSTGAFEEHRPFLYIKELRKETAEKYVRIINCMLAYVALANKKQINERQSLAYVAEVFTTPEGKKTFVGFFPK